MKVIYISPGFPENFRFFPIRLKELGASVFGIGWKEERSFDSQLRTSLDDYLQVEDMNSYENVLRASAHLISKHGKPDRILSQEEHWIDLEAALRLDFNVPGKKPADIESFRRKSLMKDVFRKAGVPVAPGELATNEKSARRFALEAGFPLIAKPDKGVGAHSTFKIRNEAELSGFFRTWDREFPYLLEGFLDGYIQSFDGLVDASGNIVFHASHRFGLDIMSAVNNDDHLHYWSLRDIPQDILTLGEKSIRAFGLAERFFHLEFIRAKDGRLTAMEINARPPGGLTMDMFNYANDADLYREWALMILGKPFSSRCERPYHVSYIGRKLGKSYARSHDDVLSIHKEKIVAHSAIDSVFRQAIGDYAYLARAKSMDELHKIADDIHSLRQ